MKLKNRLLALALTLVLLFAIVPAAYADSGFKDIPDGAWYEDAAIYCKENGLMKGVTDTEFYPGTIVTRGMVVTVLYRMAGEPLVSGDMPFTDVGIHSYCAKAVIWAAENGITLGFEDNTFRPDLEINREQFACLIGRFATAVDAPFLYFPQAEQAYTDIDSVSEFAKDGVEIVRRAAIFRGYHDGEFRPTSLTDRAQASVVFMRLHKLLTVEMPDRITVYDKESGVPHSYILMKDDAAALKEIFAGMEKSDLYAEFVSTHDIVLGDTTYRFEITDSSKLPDYCGFIVSGDNETYGGYFDNNTGKLAEVYKIMAKYIEL